MGGSGGGGGGRNDWPQYMKDMHNKWLGELDVLITAAKSANPFTGIVAYNPDSALTAMASAISSFNLYVGDFLNETLPYKVDMITVDLMRQVDYEYLPRFEAGMNDINAVQSSGFLFGRALMYEKVTQAVAREALAIERDVSMGVLSAKQEIAKMSIEFNRMKIVAKNEEEGRQTELDFHEATWPFQLYMYGGNLLGSISGGRMETAGKPPSRFQSALGGAMAGAAAGATITAGNPYGIVAGAVIGGVAGYLSS